MSQKLNLVQKQSLNMTMSLRQSINILQLPHTELSQMINSELDKNPFLQNVEEGGEDEISDKRDFDYLQISSSDNNYDSIANVSDTKSPFEEILEQIGEVVSDDKERIIAFYLANLLQNNGFIELDIEKAMRELGCGEEVVWAVLVKLQSMEPAGIFARDIVESLRIQLQRKSLYDKHFEAILLNLNLIAKHDMNSLAKIAKLSGKSLIEYVAEIKALNPRPLSLTSSGIAASRVADVIVKIDEAGDLKVMLNSETMPKIEINRLYYKKVKTQKMDNSGKEFVSGEYYNASNLVRSVNQRYRTILDVAKAIVKRQKNFFLKGVMYFEPLTLGDIASICDLNESTISRATNGKYIQTDSGMYEMKYFFSSQIASKNSDINVSSTKVKEIIKTIIETEESNNIMSDDAIALELEKYNIKVARRTVAKYRESMGIETSSVRKRKARSQVLV